MLIYKKNQFKKIISIALLSNILLSSLCFASDTINDNKNEQEKSVNTSSNNKKIIPVDHCSLQDRLTDNDVKFIKNKLFLDSEGNKVKPCIKDEDNNNIHFKIISKVSNGIEKYNKSPNQILNPSIVRESTKVNIPEYSISYGDESLDVQDVESFQQSAKKQEYDNLIKPTANQNEENKQDEASPEFLEIKKFLNLANNAQLPEKYINSIDAEKKLAIKEDYSKIISILNNKAQEQKEIQHKNFVSGLVKMNRIILLNKNIINQYPVIDLEKFDENNFNGTSYKFYKTTMAKNYFYSNAGIIFRDFTTDVSINLDTKLAILDSFISSESILENKANEFEKIKNQEWENMIPNIEKANIEGLDIFNKDSLYEKQNYISGLKDANEQIIDEELNQLPYKITKAQYMALSNLDKFKYAPEMKGKFANHSVYVRRTINEIFNTKI